MSLLKSETLEKFSREKGFDFEILFSRDYLKSFYFIIAENGKLLRHWEPLGKTKKEALLNLKRKIKK